MKNAPKIKHTNALSKNLSFLQESILKKCNLTSTVTEIEEESAAYAAFALDAQGILIRYREAKTTPKKAGQFVTLWKRNLLKITAPFEMKDNIDLFIIRVYQDFRAGFFIFPSDVLLEQKIISNETQSGKRAIRVYPPWSVNLNRQALNTQKWQSEYFLDTSNEDCLNLEFAKKLLFPKG